MMNFKKDFKANKIEVRYSQINGLVNTLGINISVKYTFYDDDIEKLSYQMTSSNEENVLHELQNNGIDITNRDKTIVINESTLLYEKTVDIDKITIEDLGKTYKVTFYDNDIIVLVSYVCTFKLAKIIQQLC